jgi:alpha-D-xyloside xylohydrolase
MVRDGAIIPQLKVAQSTKDLDWSNIDLVAYTQNAEAKGWICLPTENVLKPVSVVKKGNTWSVNATGFSNSAIFKAKSYEN